jgi:hypothetical protein
MQCGILVWFAVQASSENKGVSLSHFVLHLHKGNLAAIRVTDFIKPVTINPTQMFAVVLTSRT